MPRLRHSEAVGRRIRSPVPFPCCHAQGRGCGFFASLRMTKGGAQNDSGGHGASPPSRSPPPSGCAGQLPRPGGARGGLRPPAVPTQHHAVCGARRPRRAKPHRDPYRLPNLKSPFFFRCQNPSLFLEGKKKRVLKASFSSLRPKKLPQSPSVTAPSKREPKTGDADSSLRSE